ncbi:DUF6303 family protein [Streptomyces sp. NPDC001719]
MSTTGTALTGTEHGGLERLLEELRAAQPGPVLAEQRHQFLDLDPDLVREDYTRPADIRSVRVPEWSVAILSRLCCDRSKPGKRWAAAARWRVFVSLPGLVSDWPEHGWPASRRHVIPTVADRDEALALLGWQVEPGATWEWSEDPQSDCHGHPEVVQLLASVRVVPLAGTGPGVRA